MPDASKEKPDRIQAARRNAMSMLALQLRHEVDWVKLSYFRPNSIIAHEIVCVNDVSAMEIYCSNFLFAGLKAECRVIERNCLHIHTEAPMSEEASTDADLPTLTSDIVSAYVSRNSVPLADLPALIATVHASLSGLGQAAPEPVEDHKVRPAQIRNSITPDHLVSFMDGKPYKSLKRHLSKHGLTPEQYRDRFGLGRDYPMVAAGYAAKRSELAKSIGLGARGRRARSA